MPRRDRRRFGPPSAQEVEFKSFSEQVLQRALTCGGPNDPNPVVGHEDKVDALTAAAVVVTKQYGIQWVKDNPDEAARHVLDQISMWVKIAVFFAGFFTGGALWLTLAGWIIPIVIDLIEREEFSGACGLAAVDKLAAGASEFMEGTA